MGTLLSVEWRKDCKFSKLFMYLKRDPAALRFGMGCPGDLAQQGVVILAFLARVFPEILAWQNSKEFLRLHIGEIFEKVQCQKVASCILLSYLFFRKFLEFWFRLRFSCFLTFWHKYQYKPIFEGQNKEKKKRKKHCWKL